MLDVVPDKSSRAVLKTKTGWIVVTNLERSRDFSGSLRDSFPPHTSLASRKHLVEFLLENLDGWGTIYSKAFLDLMPTCMLSSAITVFSKGE